MFEQTFKNIDDILWKDAGADSELDYIGQTSWVLFLRYLDELEKDKADEAVLQGKELLVLKYHGIADAKKELGEIAGIRNAFIGFQGWLYEGKVG